MFLQKCPKSGLVSLKKYIVFFVTLAGGVRRNVTNVTFFFLAAKGAAQEALICGG